jgi:hemolysin activation/secretion protein
MGIRRQSFVLTTLTMVSAVTLGFSDSLAAQTIPDAGSLLQEMRERERARPSETQPPTVVAPVARPTIRLPEGATVRVASFKISGNVSIATEQLVPLVTAWQGKTLDVTGLNEAASAITRHYQSRGYLLTYAYLPVQKIDNDVVEIAVLEGRVGGVQVVAATDVRLDDAVVQNHVGETRIDTTQPARQDDIERKLLLLNDIPGVVARGAFAPGSQPGSSDLVVSVVEDEPLETSVYANNHGSAATGEYRLGAQFHLRDVFGLGDSSRVNLSWSSRQVLANGGLLTRVPIGGSGLKVSAGVSHLTYELDGEFASLGARGEANSLQFGASYPIWRTLDRNLSIEANADFKNLRDLIPLIATDTRKSSRALTFGVNFDQTDRLLGGGFSRAALNLQAGVLNLDDGAPDLLGTEGSFGKFNYDLSREQSLHPGGLLLVRLTGQRASQNLDSSEKFSLGGPNSVRAYGPGEAATDDGNLVTLEYRYAQRLTGSTLSWRAFYDYGSGDFNHQPLAGTPTNRITLRGGGLGLSWNRGDYDLGLTAAWRGNHVPSVNGDHKPRLYVQLIKGF